MRFRKWDFLQSTIITFLLSISYTTFLEAQERTLLSYDLQSGILDSIEFIAFDTSVVHERTDHNYGSYDENIQELAQEIPTVNIFPNSEFSIKEQVSSVYDLNSFPIRTSVKILFEEEDSLGHRCSGSMISNKHVLTAAHCLVEENSNMVLYDSVLVCPAFNDGLENENFGCSYVKLTYFLKDWTISGEDLAILELEERLGEKTGWIGIGYDESSEIYADDIMYKFTYPGTTILGIDPREFNGDTLYYNYGKANKFSDAFIGSLNTRGIPGESGSSIIHVVNEETYTSYGALSYSNDLQHSRIKDYIFHPFLEVIKDDLSSISKLLPEEHGLKIYPNPTTGEITLLNDSNLEILAYKIYNSTGKIITKGIEKFDTKFSLEDLADGVYYLQIETKIGTSTLKVIKS